MELFWGVFFLVMVNQLINAYVLNQVVKDRTVLAKFIKSIQLYTTSFELIGSRYNEVINMVNKHSDILEEVISVLPNSPDEALDLLEWRKARREMAHLGLDGSTNSTDTE